MVLAPIRWILGPAVPVAALEDRLQDAISFPGKIHLIVNDQELARAAPALREAGELGFDTETRPSFRKGEVYQVALLQLATDDDAFLIRLHGLRAFDLLREVFENEAVLKVGAAIRDDLRQLQARFKFLPKNFVELQDVAKAKGLQNFGLKGMTEEVLGARLSKGPKLTNWEAPTLSEPQLHYAATDAWIGLHLHRALRVRADVPRVPGKKDNA